MKNFAMTGIAGYIAPRHLKAIKDTGNKLVAAIDPHDSVGILDSYFPESSFFTEYERFDRHLEMLRRANQGNQVHYLSICSPNHLHDAHIRLALRVGAHAICEKPLVLNPWNLDRLQEIEAGFDTKVYSVLQLRIHPSLIRIKQEIDRAARNEKYTVKLNYITTRGSWYRYSWKGDSKQSGGITTNIGIHFFDLLIWLFGGVKESKVYIQDEQRVGGFLELEKANVGWFLSLDPKDLPRSGNKEYNDILKGGNQYDQTGSGQSETRKTFRSITIDGKEIEFSDGFTDLHTRVYEEILEGRGFGIEDARPSIELVHTIRNSKASRNGQWLSDAGIQSRHNSKSGYPESQNLLITES